MTDKINDFNFLTDTCVIGNKLVVESYKKEALRSKEVNGFARLDQKDVLKALLVLVNAKLPDGTLIKKDSKAYIKEELLHTQPWAQKSYTADSISGTFFMVDMLHVEFIQPPKED